MPPSANKNYQEDQLDKVLESKVGPLKMFVAKWSKLLKDKNKEYAKKTNEPTKVEFILFGEARPQDI